RRSRTTTDEPSAISSIGLGSSYSNRTARLGDEKIALGSAAVRTNLDEISGQRLHAGEIAIEAVDDRALFRGQCTRSAGLAEESGEGIEDRIRRFRCWRDLAAIRNGRFGDRRSNRAAGVWLRLRWGWTRCWKRNYLGGCRDGKAGKQRYKSQFVTGLPHVLSRHHLLQLSSPRYPDNSYMGRLWRFRGPTLEPKSGLKPNLAILNSGRRRDFRESGFRAYLHGWPARRCLLLPCAP